MKKKLDSKRLLDYPCEIRIYLWWHKFGSKYYRFLWKDIRNLYI